MLFSAPRRTALVVAHPAHELRLFGWVEATRPVVHVLTDGSGRRQQPRLGTTARLLSELGASAGDVFGPLADLSVYRALLAGEHDDLLRITEALAESFVRDRVDTVVVDADEGAILTHDVLHGMTRAAVLAASVRLGRPITVYDFPLEGSPSDCPAPRREGALWLRLDPRAFEQKLAAVWSYAEVRNEVTEAMHRFGHTAFSVECLRVVRNIESMPAPRGKTVWERHGERMVQSGAYREVLRFDDHVRPFFERLGAVAPAVRRELAAPKAA